MGVARLCPRFGVLCDVQVFLICPWGGHAEILEALADGGSWEFEKIVRVGRMPAAKSRLPGDAGGWAAAAREGICPEPLSRHPAEHIPGFEGPLSADLLTGGRSTLTYILRTPIRQWVLQRPPLGHILPTTHNMGRDFA